jgi:hypothetical protein
MTVQEWGIVVGVVASGLLALAPWMFMVHARLAVLSAQMVAMDEKIDKLAHADEKRRPWCYQHEVKLTELERRLDALEE